MTVVQVWSSVPAPQNAIDLGTRTIWGLTKQDVRNYIYSLYTRWPIVQRAIRQNHLEAFVAPASTMGISPDGKCKANLADTLSKTWRFLCKIKSDSCISYPDKTRGVFNEGGLYGERQGWHLPGFDTTKWEHRDLSLGLPDSAAGVGFFVTTFDLNIPGDQDAFLSFNFDNGTLGQPYRAYLFVNGWMMGKRVGNLGSAAFLTTTKLPVIWLT